jgi:hypothetical protein
LEGASHQAMLEGCAGAIPARRRTDHWLAPTTLVALAEVQIHPARHHSIHQPRASSIIAIKGKDFMVRHFDHAPTLTKEMLFARDRYVCAYCAQRFRFEQHRTHRAALEGRRKLVRLPHITRISTCQRVRGRVFTEVLVRSSYASGCGSEPHWHAAALLLCVPA